MRPAVSPNLLFTCLWSMPIGLLMWYGIYKFLTWFASVAGLVGECHYCGPYGGPF
jgi:hypothetical protein